MFDHKSNAFYSWNILIILGSCYVSFGALDTSAVLLECEKESSKGDIKRTSPPYHTIDNCIRKIRITLNVTNSGKTATDLDYAFLSEIIHPDTGNNLYLLNPVVLRLRQDQVLLAYPFNYLSAVNGKATEVVVNYQNRKNFTGCDATSQINPTCGLKHDRGKSTPYSEGFCCFCPGEPVKEKQPRGGQDCSLVVGEPTDLEKQKYKASAHCLHLSDIWYSVSVMSEPIIIHETYIQVFNQKHLKNGSSVWVSLTHNEEFELGLKNPFQHDENKTIIISYLTGSRNGSSSALIKDKRLLTPQPMPAVELSKLPAPVKNGASDYLLIPKDIINSDGDQCDVAGVSYEGFALQPDRCNVKKDTCLKNQPLDFWEMDDGKRKSGAKGIYMLGNYGVPYKDPIIVHPETKQHWLALEYYERHQTVLIVEINADEIVIMSVGKYAQISKMMSSATDKIINIFVSVLNAGLMPANYTVQAVKCAFGVADSNKESAIIPPQMTQDFIVATKPGGTSLNEEFSCIVQVSSAAYGIVATRDITINPFSRCVCNFHCECACISDGLKCELMSEEDYHAAGFRGSLPILTAKPHQGLWAIKHPFLAFFAFILFLLLLGFIKGILGLAGFTKIRNFGLDKFLYQPKKLKRYPQPDLKSVNVMYDTEGYPIHPDTKERIQVISDELIFGLNFLFFFFWPCTKCQVCCKSCSTKIAKLQKRRGAQEDIEKEESDGDRKKKKPEGDKKKEKLERDKKKEKLERDKKKETGDKKKETGDKKERKSDDEKPTAKKHFWQKGKDSTDPAKSEPSKSPAKGLGKQDLSTDKDKGGHRGARGHEKSVSARDVENQLKSAGPVADPLNKEQERWKKGKTRIQAVKK